MADSTPYAPPPRDLRPVSLWLFVMCGLIALMVTVGGATRLTDSGLSIVEWRPVTGAVPPLGPADWAAEFEKYKAIPEYQLVNRGMSLDEFKRIYWWEWGHRFLGRLIGAAFLLPLAFFLLTRRIGAGLTAKLAGLFALGGLQGALGWYMVQSGLADRIDVSQYRLAAHLGLAVLLFAAMFWLALDLRRGRAGPPSGLARGALALAGLVYLQMLLGAIVAGLRAGRVFNTWPLMDGRFVPEGYFSAAPSIGDLFETAAAAQFNHRIGAYLVVLASVLFWLAARRQGRDGPARLIILAVIAQAGLGVWTVLAATPLALGLLHQAGALVTLAACLAAAHRYWGEAGAKSGMATGASLVQAAGSTGSKPSPAQS